MTVRQRPDPARRAKSEDNRRRKTEHGRAPAAKGGFGRPLRWAGPNPGALRRLCPGPAPALLKVLVSEKPAEPERTGAKTMDQTIELRIVDPKTLSYADKRDPRQVPADRLSDAALKANSNAIGFVQPPLFSEEEDGTLTIIAGRRRIKSAIANKLKEMAILVKPADPLDDMRSVAENVVRAPMSPVDLWRAIEDLASKSWTEEAIATAFAVPLRQVRKLRLLGAIHPAMLEHIGRGDMPEERYLRTILFSPPRYHFSMPDDPKTLCRATAEDVADALAFALRFQGRKRVHNADELMSAIVAKRLVEHLERSGG